MDILFIYFTIFSILLGAIAGAAVLIWFERRLLGLWQDRLGPNRVGPLGIGLALADIIKMFAKEDWVPPFADKPVFVFAPTVVMITILLAFAVVPFAPGFYVVDLNIALLFFLGMSSLAVYSVLLSVPYPFFKRRYSGTGSQFCWTTSARLAQTEQAE